MVWRVGAVVVCLATSLFAQSWEELVAQAREAARSDRNAQAAALFQQALALDPSRRPEIARELADQLTYSGRPAEAVPLFVEALESGRLSAQEQRWARLGLALALSWSGRVEESLGQYRLLVDRDPRDVDALVGLGRVLSWLDRHAESLRAYQAALLLRPTHGEAQRSVGRVLSWRGRQREARRVLEDYLEIDPGQKEALFLLGQAEHWMGRPDRASATLGGIGSPDRDALLLRDDVARAQSDEARLESRHSTQSDRLDITRNHLRYVRRFERGLSQAGLLFERIDYRPERGEDVRVDRPGLTARRRFSDAIEWNAAAYYDRIDSRFGTDGVVTFDTWATYWPDDFWRFDISANRYVPDNVTSQERSISATTWGISGDYLPTERTRLSARAGFGRFSDGNRSVQASGEYEQRVMRRPPLKLGLRASAFHFEEQLGNGYFDPDQFLALSATARLAGKLREGVWYGLFGAGGYEFIRPGENKPQYAINGNMSWQFTRQFQLELRAERFSSRQASSSGFARNSFELALRYTPIE